MTMVSQVLRGESIFARAMRSSLWTVAGYGGSQALRLASNLILTRLLFPESFGMMALVTVVLVGLYQFSDFGIGPAIMQNRRGDDRAFLDTAWTIQVVRGAVLWLLTCVIAFPVARFYGEPMLAELLPVAGFGVLIAGFNPTRIETANRHLMVGRMTLLDLASQVIGLVAIILLAWQYQSVWALVVGGLISAVAKLMLTRAYLPGEGNRFVWDRAAARDLVRFGKWIFLSTVCGFLIAQGDRVILGKYLTLDMLGVYNIGYFLASFPLLLGGAVIGRIFIPLYRESPPTAAAGNFQKIRMTRLLLTGALITGLLTVGFFGIPLVGLLYDERYAAAGPIVVLIACLQIPTIIGLTYDQAALAAGDSRRFFYLLAVRATLITAFFVIGAETAGLVGALAGQGLALVLAYPMVIWLARLHKAWDPLHDGLYAAVGLGIGSVVVWQNRDAILGLTAIG